MRVLTIVAASLIAATAPPAFGAEPDWKAVDAIFARSAAQSGDVHRYAFPRSDLTVTLDGVTIKTALGLGGWVAFKPMGDEAMIMGDLVLTESEVNPVMASLLAGGVTVTAVHNHLLRASPATFYMHVGGHGDPAKIAEAIRAALALSATPLTVPPAVAVPATALDFDTAGLEDAIGLKGRVNGGVYQFSAPRADAVKDSGMVVAPAMGLTNVINFQPTGDGKAAITGDFVALANEVNPLIGALRSSNIEVTAVHNHMLNEEPRTFFIHFWANDDAIKLARGIRAALDQTNVPAKGVQ